MAKRYNHKINLCYLAVSAIMMLLRDVENDLRMERDGLKNELKQRYSDLYRAIERVIQMEDKFDHDVTASCGDDWQKYEFWQEDYNSLCRLLMLWADRTLNDKDAENAVFKAIRSIPSKGVFTEKDIEWFYLRKAPKVLK